MIHQKGSRYEDGTTNDANAPTREVVSAGTPRIDWLDPGTRVSWSEIVAKAEEFGIKSDPVTLRLDFDRAKRR